MKQITIGLFGTCGQSKWREPFMKEYDKLKLAYFNPQKTDWRPEDAQIEADHLANDEILLFPVTNETFAFGSLAETGFSILQALKMDQTRDIIVMIEPDVVLNDKDLLSNCEEFTFEKQRKESCRARALVMAHLKKINYPNVWIVKDLNDMLKLSLELHAIQVIRNNSRRLTIQL